jgi:hypothetical protein
MVAMTASLPMSSQVGATAVRTRSAASAGEQDPGGEFEPDLAPAWGVRLALPDRFRHERERLHGAESDDEHGAGLNDERNEFGNLLELAVDRHG